jgi:hypothetical protein
MATLYTYPDNIMNDILSHKYICETNHLSSPDTLADSTWLNTSFIYSLFDDGPKLLFILDSIFSYCPSKQLIVTRFNHRFGVDLITSFLKLTSLLNTNPYSSDDILHTSCSDDYESSVNTFHKFNSLSNAILITNLVPLVPLKDVHIVHLTDSYSFQNAQTIIDRLHKLSDKNLTILSHLATHPSELSSDQVLYDDLISRVSASNNLYYNLISSGKPNTESTTIHQIRLLEAYTHFKTHIDIQVENRDKPEDYLKNLFDAITRKLNFTFYTIEEECEIGMSFELMNARGKGLSTLELLKNYLMHWVSRNVSKPVDRKDLTGIINRNWKEVYANIGQCGGSEDQCLRIAWVLYCEHAPKLWWGYDGFKKKEYLPLRDFTVIPKENVREFISTFSKGLAEVSRHYAILINPTNVTTISKEELEWLSKIHNTGNIANFLPLLVSARKQATDTSSFKDYYNLLKTLECYAYRVFIFSNKRGDAGRSQMYKYAYDVFKEEKTIEATNPLIYGLARYYSNEDEFNNFLSMATNWYPRRRILKYTLFEYELFLLADEGKGKKPKLAWSDLTDSTIEHILPQTPEADSEWLKVWNKQEDIDKYLHDIGNLVLTENNSNYYNFEFERKKGTPGAGYCYANSDIRQERKIAAYDKWDVESVEKRRNELTEWIKMRWGINSSMLPPTEPEEIIEEEENEDE